MPMSKDFQRRLYPVIARIADEFGTAAHIYDKLGIIQTGNRLKQAFTGLDYNNFFAVKAVVCKGWRWWDLSVRIAIVSPLRIRHSIVFCRQAPVWGIWS
jgi:hypothetical protein